MSRMYANVQRGDLPSTQAVTRAHDVTMKPSLNTSIDIYLSFNAVVRTLASVYLNVITLGSYTRVIYAQVDLIYTQL